MNWRNDCKIRIADAIASWPVELCGLTAEYAAAERIRFGAAAGVVVSSDRSVAEINDSQDLTYIDGIPYVQILACKPLADTATEWTLKLTALAAGCLIAFRIGVDSRRWIPENMTTPSIIFSLGKICTAKNGWIGDTDVARFVVTADLATGVVSARTEATSGRTAAKPFWSSPAIDPVDLRAAIPVVYFYGVGSKAELIE